MSKIENPKVEVPTGADLNDKDIANLTLTTLKNFTKNYATALTEASNDHLYKALKKQFDEASKLQREAFLLTFRNGWYGLEEADGAKVGEKYNHLNQCFEELQTQDEEMEEEEDE